MTEGTKKSESRSEAIARMPKEIWAWSFRKGGMTHNHWHTDWQDIHDAQYTRADLTFPRDVAEEMLKVMEAALVINEWGGEGEWGLPPDHWMVKARIAIAKARAALETLNQGEKR